jgi:large subunit ribosomal protein L2
LYFLQRIKKKLIIGFSKRAGKNSFGRKTIFTQSGGLRLKLFSVDFKRNQKYNAILFSIEKKNQYTSFLGLVFFSNGIICYILLSNFMLTIGQQILGLSLITKKNSISSYLKNIPSGNFINHIETKVNSKKGAVIMRAAGTTCFIISKDKNYSYLKLTSG